MLEITFPAVFGLITALWILVRFLVYIKTKSFKLRRELQLILIYICLVVIARMVYFPLSHVDGHIGTAFFDSSKLLPLHINLKPFTFLHEKYNGWQINILGNILMFVPVGIFWPLCFKKLDNIFKSTLAGFGLTLFIELTQLLLYDRCSDVDDLILNTFGAFLGSLLFFVVKSISRHRKISK